MRAVALFVALACGLSLTAQIGLRINEVQAANAGTVGDAHGNSPDWIEFYNSSERSIDLQGMRLVIANKQHLFETSLPIAAKGHMLLWCDGRPDHGPEHIGFKLPREGGSVILIANDQRTILDAFTWPALPSGSSMGRVPDGSKDWSIFAHPSPGTANPAESPVKRIATIPTLQREDLPDGTTRITLGGDERDTIRYTVDGTVPKETRGTPYSGSIILQPGTALRARAFAPDAMPGKEAAFSLPAQVSSGLPMALFVDPQDLWNDSTGINTAGHFTNHTRKGRDWERPALLTIGFDTTAHTVPVGVRISGSGSRGAHKRNFKVYSRGRYDSPKEGLPFPDGSHFDEGMLRADASTHAFLRGRLIETLVQGDALNVDMQFSTPVELHLNGRYWGLYRWMPPKDAQWVKHISGAEAVDLLAGPAAAVMNGSDKKFDAAISALVASAPLDSISAAIDLENLIDLACIDLWTGRADHDLNVRCYRPRQTGGRLRWILFDLDLWSPVAENSVERMCSATSAETPYIKELLAHPQLQEQLLARMTGLQATTFHPDHARLVLDSLFRQHEEAMLGDHRRWELELGTPSPDASRSELDAFISERPEYLMKYLAGYTGKRLRSITIDVPNAEQGVVLLEGQCMEEGRTTFQSFDGIALQVQAFPAEGWEFAGWKSGREEGAELRFEVGRTKVIKPLFRPLIP